MQHTGKVTSSYHLQRLPGAQVQSHNTHVTFELMLFCTQQDYEISFQDSSFEGFSNLSRREGPGGQK